LKKQDLETLDLDGFSDDELEINSHPNQNTTKIHPEKTIVSKDKDKNQEDDDDWGWN